MSINERQIMFLKFKELEFTNFKCFLEIDAMPRVSFEDGLNLITGVNGKGKTTIAEALSVLFFGQTLDKKKERHYRPWGHSTPSSYIHGVCEIDGVELVVERRGSKISKFELGGEDMRKLATSEPQLQSLLEKTIRIEFDLFRWLVLIDSNSLKPILDMTTPQRRDLVEQYFGVGIISEMLDYAKKKRTDIVTQFKLVDSEVRRLADEKERASKTYMSSKEAYELALEETKAKRKDIKEFIEMCEKNIHLIDERLKSNNRHLDNARALHELVSVDVKDLMAQAREAKMSLLAKMRLSVDKRLETADEHLAQLQEQRDKMVFKATWDEIEPLLKRETGDDMIDLGNMVSRLYKDTFKTDLTWTNATKDLRLKVSKLKDLLEFKQEAFDTAVAMRAELQAKYDDVEEKIKAWRMWLVSPSKKRYDALVFEGTMLKEKMAKLKDSGAECSACGQPLTAEHLAEEITKCEADLANLRASVSPLVKEYNAVKDFEGLENTYMTDLTHWINRENTLAQEIVTIKTMVELDCTWLMVGEKQLTQVEDDWRLLEEVERVMKDLGFELHEPNKKWISVYNRLAREFIAEKTALHTESLTKAREARAKIKEEISDIELQVAKADRNTPEDEAEAVSKAMGKHLPNFVLASPVSTIGELDAMIRTIESKISRDTEELSKNRESLTRNTIVLENISDPDATLMKHAEAEMARMESEITEGTERLKKADEEQTFIADMIDVLGDDGVRKYFVEQAVPVINDKINEYLGMFGIPLEVTLDGTLNAKLLHLGHPDTEPIYKQFSKGQRKRIDFACFLAFHSTITTLLGWRSNLIFLDEFLDDGIDDEGLESFIERLRVYTIEKKDLGVWIISHKINADYFDGWYEVTDGKGGSVLGKRK